MKNINNNVEYEVIICYQDPWEPAQGSVSTYYYTKDKLLKRIMRVEELGDDGITDITINGVRFTGKSKNWYWMDREDTQKVIDYVQSL